MADTTYAYTPGSGGLASVDRIASTDYPHYKLKWGPAGTVTDVSAANPIPVTTGTVTVTGTVTANVGTGTQPVSGTVAATQSGTWNIATITTLPAITGAVSITGTPTVTANVGTGTQAVSGNVGIDSASVQKGGGNVTATTLRVTMDTDQLGTLIGGAVPVVNGGLTEIIVNPSGTPGTITTVALEHTTGSGAPGDMLDHLVCTVTDVTHCGVYVRDGSAGSWSTAYNVLPNNIAAGISVQHIVLGGEAAAAGGWQVGTDSGVIVRAFGTFT
jgi:hypothetical protein